MTLLASPAHWLSRAALAVGILAASPAAVRAPALAHPHVFVTTNATVVIENGAISAIDHVWTFDEFYTAMAIEGLDTNKDGTLSPDEMTAGIRAELKSYDKDANGTLSLEEFAVMHTAHTRPMTVRAFQMHDADGDAQVTEAEMAEMAAMMQSHMDGQQDGMPNMGKGMMGDN